MKLYELLKVVKISGHNARRLHIFEIDKNGEHGKDYFIKHADECDIKLLDKEIVSINLYSNDLTINIK